SNAALMADTICALEWPAITSLVRRSAIGHIDRAAWRGILSTPLLALLHHLVQIRNRPYLNRSKSILKAWKLRDKLNGVIEVSRLKDLNAADLFLGFRIRA